MQKRLRWRLKSGSDSMLEYWMRRKLLRQIFLRSRNPLIKCAMHMAMDLYSFCLDNDRVEGLLLNKNNRDLYMEIFEWVHRTIEIRYLKKINEYDVSDMNTYEELMDCIQFCYSEIDRSLKDISFTIDDVISELEVYDTEHKKTREYFIKIK